MAWSCSGAHNPAIELAPQSAIQRTWYTRNTSVSFKDILSNLRQAIWQEKVAVTKELMHTRAKILCGPISALNMGTGMCKAELS
jgi:hypothetical protein